jgi:TPR repeat protein
VYSRKGRDYSSCAEVLFARTSIQNPTGVNKQAALLEQNQDEPGAFQLYEDYYVSGKANALLIFNLGWYHVHGIDTGIKLWKEAATTMVPDEGSEEAAWYLSQEYFRENPTEAKKWLDLANELGYHEDC